MRRATLWGLMAIAVAAAACGSGGNGSGPPAAMVDGGSWYPQVAWPHDGQPVVGDRFTVYSDAASLDARRQALDAAERLWDATLATMGIGPEVLTGLPPGQASIDLYLYHDRDPGDWGARAYDAGVIVWSPDHPGHGGRINGFDATLHHELVHVVQWLISGPEPGAIPTWYLEGLPEAISGGTGGGAIRSRDRLDHLTDRYGVIVPVSVRSYDQITDADAGESFYYPMFQLAVEYLVDADGAGASPTAATGVLVDVEAGLSFEEAFEQRFGLTVGEYEATFFDRMGSYLPAHRRLLFTPIGIGVFGLLVAAGVAALLALTARLRRPGTADPWGPVARIAAPAGVVLTGVLTIVFAMGGLYSTGTAAVLDNASNRHLRAAIYLVLAGYLVVSVQLLLWMVDRWVHHSRTALLALPLAAVVALGALLVVSAVV